MNSPIVKISFQSLIWRINKLCSKQVKFSLIVCSGNRIDKIVGKSWSISNSIERSNQDSSIGYCASLWIQWVIFVIDALVAFKSTSMSVKSHFYSHTNRNSQSSNTSPILKNIIIFKQK